MANMVEQHIPCPCGKSSDAYCLYDDGHGWCFSCGKGEFPKDWKKDPEDYEELRNTNHRGVNQKVLDLYGVKTYGESKPDKVMFRTYPYPNDVTKIRRVGDKNFRIERKGKMSPLFGANVFNAGCSHYITVVEGEEDALALFQILNFGDKGQKATLYPVVALSSGVPRNGRDEIYKYLSSFETVKLCIEDDETGQKNKSILSEMLPNKIREVKLTKYKDASEYLKNGEEKELLGSWNNAKIFTPDNILHTEEDCFRVLMDEDTETVVPTRFTSLNDCIRGIPLNHVTLITAQEGMGKTELLRAFEFDLMKAGEKVAVLHFEETKNKFYKALACYELCDNVRDCDDVDKVLKAVKNATANFDNLYVFEFKNEPTVDVVLEMVNYLVHVCGVRYVCVDPINQFDPVGDENKVDFLDSLAKKLEKYCAKNPVGLVWTAHVDDEGRTRNSRMIGKACSIRIDLTREFMHEDPEVRNRLFFKVSKNRPFSTTGPAGEAFFDVDSFTVENVEEPGEVPF
jgi:twinkle protein